MAFSVTPRGSRRNRYRPLAEINVTPLVDVMLVLLVIFMVTAPLMTSGVSVDLPKVKASTLNTDSEPLTVLINSKGVIYLQDQQLELPDLVTRLQALSKDNPERRIFVRGDKDLPYGRIMEVMGTITQDGFTKVALLADPPAGDTATPVASPTGAAPTGAGSPSTSSAGGGPSGAAPNGRSPQGAPTGTGTSGSNGATPPASSGAAPAQTRPAARPKAG